jgi:hypothetical protein
VSESVAPADIGGHIGTANGRYALVHYRVEGGNIVIAFENITTAAMSGLVVDVSQTTAAGFTGSQVSRRLLKMKNFYHVTVPIAHTATGEITVSYFFTPKRETLTQPNDEYSRYDSRDILNDSVSFKLNLGN